MLFKVIYFVAFVLILDSALLAVYAHGYYISVALIVAGSLGAMTYYVKRKAVIDLDGFYLGEGIDISNPNKPEKRKVMLNLMLGFISIGGPGCGKSMFSVLVLRFFTQVKNIGWVFWCGKGDFDVYQKVVASGAKPDKFFSIELPNTDTTNIVTGEPSDVIEAITQALITTDNEFYKTAQREAVGVMVRLLKATGKRVVLKDIFAAIKYDDAALYALSLAVANHAPREVTAMAEQYLEKDYPSRAGEVSGLLTTMGLFVTGDIADRLNAYYPSLDLVTASKENQRVYMHLPYSSISKDVAIFLTEIVGAIARKRQQQKGVRTPWPMVFDDWGKFFYANAGAITARCRSVLMPFSYLFQSIGQLDAVSSNFRVELADNVADKYFFRINGPETASWASRQFGEYERRNVNAQGDLVIEDRPRVRDEDIGDLNAGEAYIRHLEKGPNGKSKIRRVKIQTPFFEGENEDLIEWPTITHTHCKVDDECLQLWEKFIEGDRGASLKAEIEREARLALAKIKEDEAIFQ